MSYFKIIHWASHLGYNTLLYINDLLYAISFIHHVFFILLVLSLTAFWYQRGETTDT